MTTIVAYCEFLSSGGSINLQGYLGCNKLLMLAGFYASRFAIVKWCILWQSRWHCRLVVKVDGCQTVHPRPMFTIES